LQPLPAPRFSRTAADTPRPAVPAADIGAVLKDWV
jgi:alpha-methylacyl-CoA racemase